MAKTEKPPHPAAQQDHAVLAPPWGKRLFLLLIAGGLAYGGYLLVPAVQTAVNTISTDDAYVNGDVTFGQRVRSEVDMYGRRREYEGRITGFTLGTGQMLSLLPPQNATGNYVKIVQRLPVRIELTDYDPEKATLFVGLSVVPYVYFKEPPAGPHAGEFLQPVLSLPEARTAGEAQQVPISAAPAQKSSGSP
jgi:multidrug resistance efflux pump